MKLCCSKGNSQSVSQSVGRSVGWSVGQLISQSVENSVKKLCSNYLKSFWVDLKWYRSAISAFLDNTNLLVDCCICKVLQRRGTSSPCFQI